MLQHSFVLDALETTGADTFEHFEVLIEEHRHVVAREDYNGNPPSRLKTLVPTIGSFHTPLPLRAAFEIYNDKHRLTKRKHIQISFNEIRHILNLAQIMALRQSANEEEAHDLLQDSRRHLRKDSVESDDSDLAIREGQLNGPRLISFDGDQTLYSDGENFERNPRLANYLYLLLRHGVCVAVVTAAGYEYVVRIGLGVLRANESRMKSDPWLQVEKYEYRLSGLLHYFKLRGLTEDECHRFYLFGGECNYLLQLGSDFRLHPVRERGPGGWMTSTAHLPECPANWSDVEVNELLDRAEAQVAKTLEELNLRGKVIRKRRSVGLVPNAGQEIPRESLDETVLRIHEDLQRLHDGRGPNLPYCAFNGGSDAWIDAGNKRVGVQVLQSYLGIPPVETLHIGDQFLNTGNDFAARDVSPCIWIINPQETTYILKSILRLAGVSVMLPEEKDDSDSGQGAEGLERPESAIDFAEMERRAQAAAKRDVYTGEIIGK